MRFTSVAGRIRLFSFIIRDAHSYIFLSLFLIFAASHVYAAPYALQRVAVYLGKFLRVPCAFEYYRACGAGFKGQSFLNPCGWEEQVGVYVTANGLVTPVAQFNSLTASLASCRLRFRFASYWAYFSGCSNTQRRWYSAISRRWVAAYLRAEARA